MKEGCGEDDEKEADGEDLEISEEGSAVRRRAL
jgi:hypothetical protein